MNNPVLLFDGVCNLCNGFVRIVLKHEKEPTIKFSALQSQEGIQITEKFHLHEKGIDSIVFIENNVAYVKSSAALKIAKHLKAPWSFVTVFRFLPQGIADFLYDLIAKYRYRIFGKSDKCMIPDQKWKSRFLN